MSKAFITYLSGLDRGARARLRRNLQHESPYPSREAMRYVEPFVLTEHPFAWRRQTHYLIAGLYALRYPDPNESPAEGDAFAAAVAKIVQQRNRQLEQSIGKESSLERRFFHLLEAEKEELAYALRQWMGLMKAAQVNVDFAELLKDITFWNERTKDAWARCFYRALKPSVEIKGTTENTPEEEPA